MVLGNHWPFYVLSTSSSSSSSSSSPSFSFFMFLARSRIVRQLVTGKGKRR
jgi:hypothetical protein